MLYAASERLGLRFRTAGGTTEISNHWQLMVEDAGYNCGYEHLYLNNS